jgi:hypothetical protein
LGAIPTRYHIVQGVSTLLANSDLNSSSQRRRRARPRQRQRSARHHRHVQPGPHVPVPRQPQRGVRGRPQLGPHRPGGLVHLAREVKPTGAQRSLVRKHPGLIIPPSSIWHPLCVAAQQARVARPRSASWWPKMRRYPHIDRPCNFETPRWVFRYPKTAPAMHPGDGIRSGAVALPRRVFRPTVVAQFAPRWGRRRQNRSK